MRFVRLLELQQDYHVCHNSRRTLKQRKQYRMLHYNVRFVEMSVHQIKRKGAKFDSSIRAIRFATHLQNNIYFTQNATYILQEIYVFYISQLGTENFNVRKFCIFLLSVFIYFTFFRVFSARSKNCQSPYTTPLLPQDGFT
jgi:hypothetical protein